MEQADTVADVRSVRATPIRVYLSQLTCRRLYLVSFVDNLLVSVQSSLNPYITSTFGRHGLLAAVSIVPSILGGTAQLTLAKIIDLWGRIEGFLFMLTIVIVGCVVKATSQDIQTYIAAHTLYWTGHLGMLYIIDVMLSDMTTLKNRMIILTVNTTPQIATTFAGPRIAELFYNQVNFRWAFGAFSFILAGICLPVIVIMLRAERKAKKQGMLQSVDSGRSWLQEIIHVYIQMDSK
jgi:MFS family permease